VIKKLTFLANTFVLLAFSCLPIAAAAHHSRAEFSDRELELEGELIEVAWRNPHPLFNIRSIGDNGEEEVWRLEVYGNALTLQRTGVSGEMFVPGSQVRVFGRVSDRRDRVMLTSHIQLHDGTEAVFEYEAGPHWSENAVGGRDSWVIDEAVLRQAADENRGIFRVWSIPRRGLEREHFPYNAAALAAQAEWDPLDNFLRRCESHGMPSIMRSSQPMEFVKDGDAILIQMQFFNVVRTVHMRDVDDTENQAASKFGYSAGRWEDDNTLVIETTRINWPYVDLGGAPLSEDARILERLTLSDDQSRLDYHMTIIDPAYLTEPATLDRYWLALGLEVQHYECVVEQNI
jgi:hypothetical protein